MIDYALKSDAETVGVGVWHNAARKLFNFKNKRILDIGCGAGGFLHVLRNDANVLGLDPNPNNIKIAQENGIEGINDFFPPSGMGANKIKEFSPDVISCFEVIEHVYSPKQIFSSAYQLLQDSGGYFIVSTPNAFHLLRIWSMLVKTKTQGPIVRSSLL